MVLTFNSKADYLNAQISTEQFHIYYEDSEGTAIPPNGETNFEFCYNSHFNTKHIYGVECYRFVNDYLIYLINNVGDSILDIRIFRLLMEHKKLMLERLNYYQRSDYFNIDLTEYIRIGRELNDVFTETFYALLKNKIKKSIDRDLLIKTKEKIIEASKIEEEYMSNFLFKILK